MNKICGFRRATYICHWEAGNAAPLDSFVPSGADFPCRGSKVGRRVEDIALVAPGDRLSEEPPFELDTAVHVCREENLSCSCGVSSSPLVST
ncbi:hypothetical protein M404DRAFT_1006829 [Pisolithus tinctorius Marx 270]|uniref:Uncharacterized protein n=1 Tax=Pisolithus tinctorius Marx 270 TaxID=870435 RepID=A0A0C3N5H4_PISTI|nr:hypothetical protein M404DRAFT_1006829 [Pisolithus tinctorius Marx 270]